MDNEKDITELMQELDERALEKVAGGAPRSSTHNRLHIKVRRNISAMKVLRLTKVNSVTKFNLAGRALNARKRNSNSHTTVKS